MLPSPGVLCWEEDFLQHLAVKISEDSIYPGDLKGSWKPSFPLKGPTNRLTHSQALTLGSRGGMVTQEEPETYRKRLSHVALGRGLERQLPLSLCRTRLMCNIQEGSILPVLNPSP